MKIKVINLEERKDRWEYMKNLFNDYDLERFDAIKHKEGWKGCTLSHVSIIENAKKNDDDYVIVMEDDVALFDKNKFDYLLPEILSYLESNLDKWDIFQFGTTYSEVGTNDNVHWIDKELNIIEYQFGLTTSFIIYNKTVYDKMLSIKDNLNIERENVIDVSMNKFNFRLWTTIPFLAYQRDDYSSLQNRNMKYKVFFKKNQEYLKNKIKK